MKRVRCIFLLAAGLGLIAGQPAAWAGPTPAMAAAIALYTEKKYDDANVALTKLAEAEPNNPEIAYYLGLVAKRLKQPDDFVKWMEKATALAPDNATYFIGLGDAYGAEAKTASFFAQISWARKCCAALEKAVALAPANPETRSALIDYCRQAPAVVGGGMEKAYRQAEELQKLNPSAGTQLLVTLYMSEHKFDEAFKACEDALKIQPDDYISLYTFGKTAAITGQRVDDGIAMLNKCLTLKPPEDAAAHTYVWFRLGNLQEKKGDLAAARAAYETAVKLDANDKQAAEALAALSK